MLLVEPIERINYLLDREYGRHDDNRPRFRVVWANDETELRRTEFTQEGFQLLVPEVRELPKYQYCKDRYVLEQLSIVPENSDLTVKLSYEPLWTFQDNDGNYLPPRFDASKIIIETVYNNMLQKRYPKKEDSEGVLRKSLAETKEIEEKLFGNETPVGDALAYGWGTTVPGSDDQTKLGGIDNPTPKEKVN